jgi:hypothetical protein
MPIEERDVNFVTGLTAGAPDLSQFYLMAMNQAAPNFNRDMNYAGDSSVQGLSLEPLRRRSASQAPTELSMGAFDKTPDGALQYALAVSDDPVSSGGRYLHPDRYNKAKSNFAPQVGQ